MSSATALYVAIPSTFVVPQAQPPQPPPFPGTVEFADVRPPTDPPLPFIVPWKQYADTERTLAVSIPCDVDSGVVAKYVARHDVEQCVRTVFKAHADADAVVEDVMLSLDNPFKSNDGNIVWTLIRKIDVNPSHDASLGGKKLKKRHKILDGPPWSIVSFADEHVVKRNVIYDGEGHAVAQVDFGHGSSCGIHVHALVEGNLEHTSAGSADHCFMLDKMPWFWACVPDVRHEARPCGQELFNLPTECVDCVQDGMRWLAVSLPFEDYMGDRQFSFE